MKVRWYIDNTYEVVEEVVEDDGEVFYERKFKGSLSDCESYVRLTDAGVLE